jgi:inosine-uridine nucleoside N-ribohydrolase
LRGHAPGLTLLVMLRGASVAIGVVGLFAIASCGTSAGPGVASRTAVVVDTDLSWDDIAALAYLFNRDEIDVKAIAIAGDGLTHCDPGITHMRQLVAAVGHAPIPIGCGRAVPLAGSAAFPEGWRQHADAFFGLQLPGVPDQPQSLTAVGVMSEALAASTKTTVVELGPMTNLAETLMRNPALKGRVGHIYAMAGAIDVPGNEVSRARAEWNAFIDPLAAQTVLDSGVPVTLVPLDATDDVPVTVFFRNALAEAAATPTSAMLGSLFSDPYYYAGDQYFWDPAAAVVAAEPGLARMVPLRLAVVQTDGPDLGRTALADKGTLVDVVRNIDAQAFYDSYLSAVTGDDSARIALPDNRFEVSYSAGGWSTRDKTRASAGPMALTLSNDSDSDAYVVVARISPGHTVADVDALIKGPLASVPRWIEIVLNVTTPRGHPATWGVELTTGLYVVVAGGPNIPLQRLTALQVV